MTADDARFLVFPLAVLGAALVLGASVLQWKRPGEDTRATVMLTRIGYGLTLVSMALFIYVGFLAER